MTQQRIFPFRRVSVDHMVRGVTRVWWQLEPVFNDAGPYTFQLQYGRTGLRDTPDWKNIGSPVIDAYTATDSAWHEGGYDLLGHYRVVLKTANNTYVSQAANCFGELTERDWVLSREVIRKEQLRHRFVSVSGYLIKPYRFGKFCTRCRDQLTQEIIDSDCPVCSGTGFEVGYHPPLAMQCWDLSPEVIQEDVGEPKGSTRENAYVEARVIGFPALNKNDIWVNSSSDERWRIETIQVAAAIRGVPIIYQVRMGLLPFGNATYAIEVGGEPQERIGPTLPSLGCGPVAVDHNYGGPDALIYATADDCPVVGANVYLFKKEVFDVLGVNTPRTSAAAKTTTRANGRWTESLNLTPGDYAVLYEKSGEFGPDVTFIDVAVTAPCTWTPVPALGDGSGETATILNTESGEVLGSDDEIKTCPTDPTPEDDFWAI